MFRWRQSWILSNFLRLQQVSTTQLDLGPFWCTSFFDSLVDAQRGARPIYWVHISREDSSVGRASHRYRGGQGFVSCRSLDFFRLLLSICLNWKIYCDDHSSLWSTTAVQIYELLHIYFTSKCISGVFFCSFSAKRGKAQNAKRFRTNLDIFTLIELIGN